MTLHYIWSGATGSATGTSWANAFTTLAAASTPEAAGDTLYVAHDHSESTAGTVTFSSSGLVNNHTKIFCVDRGGSVPPVSADRRATAQIATSGNNQITLSGFVHWDGIIFVSGNSTGVSGLRIGLIASQWSRFDNCSFRCGSTGAGRIELVVGAGSLIELNNTTLSFSGVAQGVDIGGTVKWRNTPSALIGTAVPTTLFMPVAARGGEIECIGVDLSAAGSGKTICGTLVNGGGCRMTFVDCKLNAAVTKSIVPAAPGSNEVDFIRSAASGNYTVFSHLLTGTLEHETTIVRTGGASDGTTPIAWKVITTANCFYASPFGCPPIAIWNDTTGSSVTATVEGVWGGGAVPNNDEIWIDVEYLGDASSPQGSFVNDGKADFLATGVGQASSSETWGGSTTKFKLEVSFTPQQKGWIYARVKIGKTSSTFYIDPLVTLG